MNRLASFSEFALTRSEMKQLKGGDCMPAHWDVYVWDKNGNGGRVACALNKNSAIKLAHKSTNWGSQYTTGQWKYNPGNC